MRFISVIKLFQLPRRNKVAPSENENMFTIYTHCNTFTQKPSLPKHADFSFLTLLQIPFGKLHSIRLIDLYIFWNKRSLFYKKKKKRKIIIRLTRFGRIVSKPSYTFISILTIKSRQMKSHTLNTSLPHEWQWETITKIEYFR